MTDLITRLSKLDAPDREVDALIAAELEPHIFDAPGFTPVRPVPSFRIGSEGNTIRFEDGGIMCLSYFHRYTASVDAVIALAARVLPGWGWEIASNTNHIKNCLNPEYGKPIGKHPHWAVVANQSSRKFVDGATPAIALLIALLRAKEASKL